MVNGSRLMTQDEKWNTDGSWLKVNGYGSRYEMAKQI